MVVYAIILGVGFLVCLVGLILIKIFDKTIRATNRKWVIYFPIAGFLAMVWGIIMFIITYTKLLNG